MSYFCDYNLVNRVEDGIVQPISIADSYTQPTALVATIKRTVMLFAFLVLRNELRIIRERKREGVQPRLMSTIISALIC
jgi:hypothetical protein